MNAATYQLSTGARLSCNTLLDFKQIWKEDRRDAVRVRKSIFWIHLIFGVLSGIIVLIMAITGVALTYQKQITSWADKRAHRIQEPRDATPLSAELILKNLHNARPGTAPISITFYSDPEMPASLVLGPTEVLFANPYTGAVLGTGSQGVRTFFRIMTDWHRWLGFSGESRGIGRAITGAGNFIFLFLAITGLYLWWPQKWTGGIFRALSWFRFGVAGKARDSNWHYVFGFWCIVPLILIIMSGVVISYSWASDLVYKLAGQAPPKSGFRKPGMPPGAMRNRPSLQVEGLDPLLKSAQGYASDWKSIGIQPPAVTDKMAVFTVDTGSGVKPQLRSALILDKASGKIIRSENFDDMGPGMKARLWFRFIHTGEYYGFWGQTIAGMASVAGVILVWTGLALTFRRYIAAARRRAEA
jgi:uncharacterized iron-regulated membrane protein